jgi:hypothetical protein
MRRLALFTIPATVLACTGAPKAYVESAPAPVAGPAAASERPIPYPVTEPAGFRRAVERGTRTRTGVPGPNYWQPYTRYQLEAELDPAQNRLTGRVVIRYTNNSPDTLRFLHLHLYQNLFAPDAIRNEQVPITGGMTIDRAAMGGQTLERFERGPVRPGYAVQGTIMRVRPTANVLPGQTVELEFAWHYTVNPDGGPRGGQDGQVWYLAYWYPQMAVYDDVNGWQIDPYMGRSEFYMGYGDYDVALTVPEGWLIGATGELVNAAEVLSPQTRQRLGEARSGRGVTAVVAEADRGAGRATQRGTNGTLTWRFQARNVRDFAFGTSDRYLWDATVAEVGDHNGDGRPDTANAFAFRRPEKRGWFLGARAVQYSVEFLSRFLWPYPWPTMTAVDGVNSCSGMEYPMITCIGGGNDSMDVWGTTLHETGHMWFPMMVGSDEKRFAWQDEGLTTYNTDIGSWEAGYRRGNDPSAGSRMGYAGFARAGQEVELMRHGDLYPANSAAYGVASYAKMATNVASLRALLGDSVFLRGYREYGRRWLYRHPTPYDLFNTFNDVAGRDLGWFWRTWFFETWTLDQAIVRVRESGTAYVVEVEDRGLAPMPARLVVTRSDGRQETYEVPVERWLAGHRKAEVGVPQAATVTQVEIDPSGTFPDVDRTNNVWRRSTP